MGAGNILGLLFEIHADPSKAKAAIEAFERDTGRAFARAGQSTKPFNDELLTARESTRLLSEEFGLHLPRAVTGAIAEMLPAIAGLGGVLLGAFAIQEIPKLAAGIKEAIQSWEGFGKAEREAMAKAIEDTIKLREKVMGVEHEIEMVGQTQAAQAALRAKWAGEDADRALKPLLAAEAKVKEVQEKIDAAKRGAGAFSASAGSAYEGALKVAQAQADKFREAWKLADEQALLTQKRAAEARTAERLKETKAIETASAAAARATATRFEEESRASFVYWESRRKLAAQTTAEEQKLEQNLVHARERLMNEEAQWRFKETLAIERDDDRRAESAEKEAQRRLRVAANRVLFAMQAHEKQMEMAAREAGAERARIAAQNAAIVAEGARLTATLGFRRIAAGIEAIWETGEALKSLAFQEYRAAALHFMSAAEYGVIAGTSGRGYGGMGAGGGRMPGELSHGRPVMGSEGRPGSGAPRSESSGGTSLSIHIYGNVWGGPAGIDELAAQISDAVDRRDTHLSATRVKDSTLSRDSFNS